MKKSSNYALFSLLIALLLSVFACTGSVGNKSGSLISMDNSAFPPPEGIYRPINNDREYELVTINDNYIGAFLVEIEYYNPENGLGYLPVTSIASEAFKDRYAIFAIVIAYNIKHIGRGAFSGWRSYQNIYFLISEEDALTNSIYKFDNGWDDNCEAKIYWDVTAEDFDSSNPWIINSSY